MVSAICKAENPNTCRYHGAVARMVKALDPATADPIEYYTARSIVEQLEQEGWKEENYQTKIDDLFPEKTDPIKPVNPSGAPTPQLGETPPIVFSKLDEDDKEGTLFHKAGEHTQPLDPYFIRIQFDKEITSEQASQAAAALGYAYRTTVAGEPVGKPYMDTPFSFVVHADTTKSARDDLSIALEDFETRVPEMIKTGSPIRKTDRAGEGTKGTRLVDGLGSNFNTTIYYA